MPDGYGPLQMDVYVPAGRSARFRASSGSTAARGCSAPARPRPSTGRRARCSRRRSTRARRGLDRLPALARGVLPGAAARRQGGGALPASIRRRARNRPRPDRSLGRVGGRSPRRAARPSSTTPSSRARTASSARELRGRGRRLLRGRGCRHDAVVPRLGAARVGRGAAAEGDGGAPAEPIDVLLERAPFSARGGAPAGIAGRRT